MSQDGICPCKMRGQALKEATWRQIYPLHNTHSHATWRMKVVVVCNHSSCPYNLLSEPKTQSHNVVRKTQPVWMRTNNYTHQQLFQHMAFCCGATIDLKNMKLQTFDPWWFKLSWPTNLVNKFTSVSRRHIIKGDWFENKSFSLHTEKLTSDLSHFVFYLVSVSGYVFRANKI